MDIRKIDGRIVYENRWMTVREDSISRRDGSKGIFGVVEKPDFALIVPMLGSHLILVEQYRYPVMGRYWEFPQGSVEKQADNRPEDIAVVELREETGYTAGSINSLGYLYEAYGYSNQGFHVYLATDLEEGESDRASEEQDMQVGIFSIKEFEDMLADGSIRDSPTVAAYSLLQLRTRTGEPR